MKMGREVLRFFAAALAFTLMGLNGLALTVLSLTGYVPFGAMIAAFVFFAVPTSRDWRVLSLAAAVAALLPPLAFGWQVLRPREGPPTLVWKNGQQVELEPPPVGEVAATCVVIAALLFLSFLVAFLLWKRIVFPARRIPMPPQSNRSYMLRFYAGALALALMGFGACALPFLAPFATTASTDALLIGAWISALAFFAAPDVRDWRVLALAAAAASLAPALTLGWVWLQPSGVERARSIDGRAWDDPSFVAVACGAIAASLFVAYFAAFFLWKRVAFARS
jgi:hypothetical protein